MEFMYGCLVVLLIFGLSNCDAWQIRGNSPPDNETVTTDTSEKEESDPDSWMVLPALHLSLTGLNIYQLPDDSIANPYVVSLDLSYNNMESMSPNAFRRLPKLRSLDLSGNRVDIGHVLFRVNISQLVTLKYQFPNGHSYNRDYQNLDIDLPYYPRLKILDLKGNGQQVSKLKLETITPQLTHLDLSESDLTADKVVGHLPLTITHLFLDDNAINITQIGTLENIEELSINRNIIAKPCVNQWYGEICNNDPSRVIISAEWWRRMKRLHLSGNNIKEIVNDGMSGQFDLLELLDLSNNAISDINSSFSNFFPNLKNLSLSRNQLSSIPSTLCSMNLLETLDLSSNEINTIFADSSCTFKNLKKLNLRDNLMFIIGESNLNIFPSLTDLDLSSNRLKRLPRDWLNAEMLEILRLNDNMFKALNDIDLYGLPGLKELHVENNPLPLIHTDDMTHIWQNLTIYLKDMPVPESLPVV